MAQNLQTADILARLFNITERRVQQLAKEGFLPYVSTRPYKFDLLPAVQAYIKYLSDRANSKDKAEDVKKSESDKLRAEADWKQHKAKIAELQVNELEGKMHRSEDVEAMTNDLVYVIRGMILALPGRLAIDIVQAKTASEASAIIRAECYKILEELSEYKYDPEEYARRVRDREGWSDPPENDDE